MQTLPGSTPQKPEPVDLPDSDEKPPRELETAIYTAGDDSVTAPPQETLDFQRHAPPPSSVGGRESVLGARLTVIGRFVIKHVLGEGSFGTVYRAYDPLLDREVALKVPRFVDDSRATQERFVREAKAAARLRHPNVVAVFESGHADGHPYIATEFVDGTPLSQVLAETPDLDLRRGVEWVRQIADALHYAHTEGVVHRDIKPANIMINAAGRPQVMDFGLAKRTADDAAQMTLEGTILGTPAFMSPEQARGEMSRVGPASDQYSVGVILYGILCGKLPYEGAAWSIMSRVGDHNAAPPKPRSFQSRIPEDLEACCLKSMEKAPAARYASLNDLAEDLKRWLEGRTLLARPIGMGERFRRWCRRNRLIASLSGTLAGLLVLATIVGFVLAFQFQKLAFKATQETAKANAARSEETIARQNLERLLVDNYTENGLAAARQQDHRQAVLWFAQAATLAKHSPPRREHNLVRSASWLARAAVPTHAFHSTGTYCKALRFHSSGRYLLVESLPWEGEIHDLHGGVRLTLPQAGAISAGQWSPDGNLLVLAAHNTVSLFDFPKLTAVRQWSHPDAISCLTFNAQGNRLAVGGGKGFRVYDINDPAMAPPLTELGSRVQSIQFDKEATRLAVATDDKRLRAYTLSAEGLLGEQSLPTQELATEGAEVLFGFLAGDRLALVDNNHALRCWDFKQASQAWEKPIGRVICLDVSPDGKRVAYETLDTSYKHSAQALDAATGNPSGAKIGHRNHIHSLDWHPDGKTLLACSGDHSASVTDIDSGNPVVAQVPHNGFVLRGVWSPDGRSFATAHWFDRLVRVWRLPESDAPDYFAAQENEQGLAKVTPDGRAMILAGFDTRRTQREVQVHDTRTGQPFGARIRSAGIIHDALFLPGHKMLVTGGSVAFHPDHEVVTMQPFGAGGTVQFWNQVTGQALHTPVSTPSEPVALACDPRESTIVVLCDRGQLLLLDATTGRVRAEILKTPAGSFADKGFVIRDRIRFSPDGSRFATWGFGIEVQLRDTITGDLQWTLRHKEGLAYIHDVRFSPNGAELVTCCSDNTCGAWDVKTGQSLATLQHTGWVFNAQFNQAGDRLLTASSDRQARLWDWKTKTLLVSTLEQEDQVYGVAFAPDENIFVTASRDGSLSAWETTTGKQVAPSRSFGKMAYQVEIHLATGRLLVAGRLGGIAGVGIKEWLKPLDFDLPDADLLMLAEIISNQKILKTSVAANLTTDEWFSRWSEFQKRHPQHPVFRAQSKTR